MSTERIDYSSVQRYEDYIEQLNVLNGIECQNIVRDLDSKVSYLPRVTSVASGVGHCIFEAKLKEMLGIKEVISSSFPGKGRLVHQLLALASLEVFGKNSLPNKDLMKYFEELVQELQNYSVSATRDERSIKEAVKTAAGLFKSLLAVKNELFRIVGINGDNVRPVVEQQLYDYELHMLGVPDLVLEDSKNKRAVVIEWKSYKLDNDSTKNERVTSYEKAQVIAYAMLEARRLGYRVTVDRPEEPSVYDAISGKLADRGIEDVRVLPAVIRPGLNVDKRLTIPPHPVLSSRGDITKGYRKLRETMGEIYVTAHYLTYLVTNLKLYGYGREDLEECSVTTNGQKRIAILWPPPGPIPRGKPSNQERSRLCSVCNLKEECKFYIGERHVNYFQKMMWAVRYSALTEKEKLLWPFRAVYELSRLHPTRDYVVNKIRKGNGIIWDGSTVRFAKDVPKNRFLISFSSVSRGERFSFKVDVVDQLYYDKSTSTLVGIRGLRDYEINKTSGRINRPYVLEESTPIILYVNDGASTLPLSINMTGSINKVEFTRGSDGDYIVKYNIHIPSPALAFQEAILLKYLELYPDMFKDVILVQVGVDLTHIDLVTIDALQRVIGKRIERLQELEKEKKLKGSDLEKKKLEEYYNLLEKEKNRLDFESEFGPELVSENVLRFLGSG